MAVLLAGSAVAKIHRMKRGVLVCFSFPTAFHGKLTIVSFVMPLTNDGLAVQHYRLHSFEISEHILLLIALIRFGLDHKAAI